MELIMKIRQSACDFWGASNHALDEIRMTMSINNSAVIFDGPELP